MAELEQWFTEDLHKAAAVIVVLLAIIAGGYYHYQKLEQSNSRAGQQELTLEHNYNLDFQLLQEAYDEEATGTPLPAGVCGEFKVPFDITQCKIDPNLNK